MGIIRTTYPPVFCNFNWALSPIAMHKPDHQFCNAGYQPRWLRKAPTSLRENRQWRSLRWEICPLHSLQQSGDPIYKKLPYEGNSKVVIWDLIPCRISIRASNERCFFFSLSPQSATKLLTHWPFQPSITSVLYLSERIHPQKNKQTNRIKQNKHNKKQK